MQMLKYNTLIVKIERRLNERITAIKTHPVKDF